MAVIRLDWDGKQKSWLVTAYRDDDGKFAGDGKISNTPAAVASEVPANDGVVFSQEPGIASVDSAEIESKQSAVDSKPAEESASFSESHNDSDVVAEPVTANSGASWTAIPAEAGQ